MVILSGLGVFASAAVDAETFRVVPSIGIQETWTNDVGNTASGNRQSDFITQLTPALSINETGARVSLNGTIAVPIVYYARAGAENNQAYVQANLVGSVEALEKFFFIEGGVTASQQYLSPFGAQPPGLTFATPNRYTSVSYFLTPYIKGVAEGGVQYELRDLNSWSNSYQTPVSLNNSYYNELVGRLRRDPTPYGWQVDYDRTQVNFNTQSPLTTQLGRVRLIHQTDPQLQFQVSGGYENNDGTLTHYRGPIYGVGALFHPTDRTNVEALWEHRFFGSSYLFNFSHRMPLSTWNVNASRNITTYAQQLAALPGGSNVPFLLNQLFLSRIPDPAQRQAFINQFISDRGLPTDLSNPVTLYTQQITLEEQANASLGLLGARNSILFSIFYTRQQPISAAGNTLPGELGALSVTTQEGVSASWTHNLASQLTFSLLATVTRAKRDVPQLESAGIGTSRQSYVTATLTSPLSPNTWFSAGATYQVQSVDLGSGYNSTSISVSLNHTFR